MKLVERVRRTFSSISLFPGDNISFTFIDEQGVSTEILTEPVDKPMIVNEAVVFEFSRRFGMKRGYCVAFGEKE